MQVTHILRLKPLGIFSFLPYNNFHVTAALPYSISAAHRLNTEAPSLIGLHHKGLHLYSRPASAVALGGEAFAIKYLLVSLQVPSPRFSTTPCLRSASIRELTELSE